MNKIIEDIKKKPESVRQRWTLLLAGAGTFLAFLIWVISLTSGSPFPVSVSPVFAENPAGTEVPAGENALKSPFMLGLETVGNEVKAVGNGWKVIVKKVTLIFE